MADQGKVLITMAIPASTARGTLLSGAGTKSATLAAVGVVYEGTNASETSGQVQISGTALALGGATIAAGVPIMSDANGKAIAVTAGNEHLKVGVPLEAMADGVLSDIKIC